MSFLEVRQLRKAFGAVQALDNANIAVERGTIHGLCGANGAGKSTLIRILAGAVAPDAGEIVLDGQRLTEFSPQQATSLGIGVVYQEFALVPTLRVYENIFLGIERCRWLLPLTDVMKQQARTILGQMGVQLDPDERVESLSLHQQQMVEIAKALCRGTSLLILDEPTAILNPDEKRKLFVVLNELKRRNLCILFITHFVEELFEVCDCLTVMRDGRTVQTCSVGESSYDAVVTAMVGAVEERPMVHANKKRDPQPVLSMHAGSIAGKFSGIDLTIKKGEIVGLAGLVGSGCYEVAQTLFGLRRLDQGEIRLEGRRIELANPQQAIRVGIGYVPEDRRGQGLCLNLTSSENIALPSMANPPLSWLGIIRRRAVEAAFMRVARTLRVQPLAPGMAASGFSGGSQQKLVIGKWIEKGCRAYIFVEPTRGVDVGAKAEILRLIEHLGELGIAILLVSTDFEDIAAVCTRCMVFTGGEISGELVRPEVSVDRISMLASRQANGSAGQR